MTNKKDKSKTKPEGKEKLVKDCISKYKKRKIFSSFLSVMGGIFMPITLILLTYIIIMISKGYRLTREGQIIQTGVLSVTSNIRGASLYVNSESKGTVPKVISGIEIDSYEVEVVKEKYYPYYFIVPINPAYSFSVYAKLYLEPQYIKYTDIYDNIDLIYTSDTNNKTVILQKLEQNEIILIRCTLSTTLISKPSCSELTNINKDIDLTDFNYSKESYLDKIELKISPDNNYALIQFDIFEPLDKEKINEDTDNNVEETVEDLEATETKLILISLNEKSIEPIELNRIPKNIKEIEWSEDSGYLFFERNNDLISYDIKSDGLNLIVGDWEKDELNYQLINGSVIFWSNKGLEIRDFNGKDYEPVITPKQKFTGKPESSTLKFASEDTSLVAIDQSGLRPIVEKNNSTYVLDLFDNTYLEVENCYIEDGCSFVSFSPDGSKVIFHKDSAYHLFWIEKEEWDYITEEKLYHLFTCNERRCEIKWADDSSVLFVWMQSRDDNEEIGEIWYCDFWGRNKNKIITGVADSFVVTDKASRIHIGKINESNDKTIDIDFVTAEIK